MRDKAFYTVFNKIIPVLMRIIFIIYVPIHGPQPLTHMKRTFEPYPLIHVNSQSLGALTNYHIFK